MRCAARGSIPADLGIVTTDLSYVTTRIIALDVHTVALKGIGDAGARCAAAAALEGNAASVDGAAAIGRDVHTLLSCAARVVVTDVSFVAAEPIALLEGAFAGSRHANPARCLTGALTLTTAGIGSAAGDGC